MFEMRWNLGWKFSATKRFVLNRIKYWNFDVHLGFFYVVKTKSIFQFLQSYNSIKQFTKISIPIVTFLDIILKPAQGFFLFKAG